VTPRGRDGRSGGQDLGTTARLRRELVPQPQRGVAPITEVPDRRDAGVEGGQRRDAGSVQQRLIVHCVQTSHGVVTGVEHQVRMGVDQSGQQGDVAEVDHVQARRHRHLQAGDAAAVDDDNPGRDDGEPVEKPRCSDRPHATRG
jgi:hypothetical protein